MTRHECRLDLVKGFLRKSRKRIGRVETGLNLGGHCLVAKWVESVRHAGSSLARQANVLSTQYVKLELRRQSNFGKHSKGKWDGGGSEGNGWPKGNGARMDPVVAHFDPKKNWRSGPLGLLLNDSISQWLWAS